VSSGGQAVTYLQVAQNGLTGLTLRWVIYYDRSVNCLEIVDKLFDLLTLSNDAVKPDNTTG